MFSEEKGQEATKVEGVTAELSTKTSYGDYELDLDGLPEEIKSDNVNAVVVKTTMYFTCKSGTPCDFITSPDIFQMSHTISGSVFCLYYNCIYIV